MDKKNLLQEDKKTEEENKGTELLKHLAKKGFLLDKEPLDFFIRLNNEELAEEVLNRIYSITKKRVISKKIMLENFNELIDILARRTKEKDSVIDDFFKEAKSIEIKQDKQKNEVKEDISYKSNMRIITSEIIPYKKIEIKDFINHFRNRYNFFKDILQGRNELSNLVSIDKIGGNRNFSIIGLVRSKRITKNKNMMLEVEDLTGKISVLINQDREELFKKAKEIVLDDVIGLKCSGGREFIYTNNIVLADSFIGEKKKAEAESYALFISDIHLGSNCFLEEEFSKFIKWINGEGGGFDDFHRERMKKIKYLFVVGDNVDGVGIYPGQESLLNIKDIKKQYEKLADFFDKIPKHIKIIMCPGQHDAVRVPEPQPPIDEEFAEKLTKMNNVFLVSNPSLVEIECAEKKQGIKVLMYHGASITDWINEIDELRITKANTNPSKVLKYILRHRHLSPMHYANVYVPGEKEDALILKIIPDIITTGEMHKTDVDTYNNILIICCSCWQSTTPYEEKVGHYPDPCKVPMLNLRTREIKILDFS